MAIFSRFKVASPKNLTIHSISLLGMMTKYIDYSIEKR